LSPPGEGGGSGNVGGSGASSLTGSSGASGGTSGGPASGGASGGGSGQGGGSGGGASGGAAGGTGISGGASGGTGGSGYSGGSGSTSGGSGSGHGGGSGSAASGSSSGNGGQSGASSGSDSDGGHDHADGSVTDGSSADEPGPSIFDSAIPDSSASPTESVEIIFNDAVQTPLSCPTSHWEFSVPSTATVTLRNMGSVPLAYIAEPTGYIGGVVYTPGVPTSQASEEVGVLAPGDTANLALGGIGGNTIALIGSSKPFSIYDGGFAPADEWTISWPMGVDGSGGSSTMYVADIEWDSSCSAVERQ
jgi:hypothetical protein